MKSIFLHLVETDCWNGEPYIIKLCMDLFLGVGQSGLSISLEVTKDTTGQVFLNFTGAPSSLSLGAVFGALRFTAPSTLLLPFNGPNAMSGMPDLVGFTFVVACAGASVVSLRNIFAQVTSSGWHPWEDILPVNFWPKDSTVTVTGIITQPESLGTLAVGLQIGFSIPLVESTANVLLDVSYWPIKSNNRDPTQRSKLHMRIDPESALPAPTIDNILRALGGFSWSAVTTAIPLLQQLTTAVSVTNVVVELERAPAGGPVIALFSISALISNLKLIPKLTVEKAVLDLTYTGSSWRAQIETTILFADQYRCQTLLILPTKDVAGKFEFVNLDDAFTFGAFVKEIDPTIDITTIPVIGSETLASISLGSFSLTATFVGNSLSVTSFAVEIVWDTSSIKQLNVSNNRLTINWSRRPFPNIPAIVGQVDPSSGGTENSWRLNWEGLLSDNWILSAGFQFSRLKLGSQPTKSELILAGSILNLSDTDVSAADLTNSLTGDGTGPSSLWQGSMPSDSSFSMRELAVNCMLGEDQVYGIGAKAIWGQGGSGSAVLVVRGIQPANPNDSHWAFMLAIAVENFCFRDLTSDVDLGQAVDNNLTIVNASVLAFYEPVAKTLAEIKAALDNVKATHLLPSASSIIPLEDFSADSSLKTTAGLAVFASLSFHPPQADSAWGP
ncbi:hypothetical protein BDP27DRAFT_395642 [Rhodocollybia butyracea]|uniref:Uncharacterized protein n=1 Tax=Rhodocollybia butyracea TaxID=206335 RepID=A0A9P5Q0C4_9AGAR|nr:hypothetical protein BDP27DRAFT_395642 [Rhodocollybia butyracea]